METEKPIIQIATPSDAAPLAKLSEKTFQEAFAKLNKKDDFQCYVANSFTEHQIKTEILDKNSIFFIATLKDQYAGYAKMSINHTPECVHTLPTMELSRLYSLKQFWGSGVGPALLEACIDHARGNSFKSIWLGSWKENSRGNAFYDKMQFKIVGSKTFALGSDIQEDHIFVKSIFKNDIQG